MIPVLATQKYWHQVHGDPCNYRTVVEAVSVGRSFFDLDFLNEARRRQIHRDYRNPAIALPVTEAQGHIFPHKMAMCNFNKMCLRTDRMPQLVYA